MSAKTDQMKGRGKEAVGSLTGNKDLEAEGKADRQAGEVKEKVGEVTDKVEDVIDTTEDKVEEVLDNVKDAAHPK